MKRAVKLLTVLDIAFLLLLSLSGSIGGIGGDVVYLLAFAIPLFIGLLAARKMKREREEVNGVAEAELLHFTISGEGVKIALPLAFPLICVVLFVAWLTSLLLGAFGYSGSAPTDAPLWQMLLAHALAPALLEEMLFRYLPIKLLLPYSPRGCLIFSSLYFALIHLDLFKMPYAFIAGLLLVAVDVMTGSILPSLVIHFLNNFASVLLIKYGADATFLAVYYASLALLTVISLAFIVIGRKKYRECLSRVLSGGRTEYDYSTAVLALVCVGAAILNLIV